MSKRILVIEDQEDNRQILKDLLTSADFEVIEAVDGEAGLAAAALDRTQRVVQSRALLGVQAAVGVVPLVLVAREVVVLPLAVAVLHVDEVPASQRLVARRVAAAGSGQVRIVLRPVGPVVLHEG